MNILDLRADPIAALLIIFGTAILLLRFLRSYQLVNSVLAEHRHGMCCYLNSMWE